MVVLLGVGLTLLLALIEWVELGVTIGELDLMRDDELGVGLTVEVIFFA